MLHVVKLKRFWVLALIMGVFSSRENVNRKKIKLKKQRSGLEENIKLLKRLKKGLGLGWKCLTLFRMDLFEAAHGRGGRPPP